MRDIKTTADLYNSIVDMTKKTGQGIPMFIIDRLGKQEELKQLEKLDLIEIITIPYNTLPNDITVVIKGVYSAMREDNTIMSLKFLRRWLGIDQTNDISFTHHEGDVEGTYKNPIEVFNEWRIESKKDYLKWISDNLEELEQITEIEHKLDSELLTFMLSDIKQGSDIHDHLTSRNWFVENLSIEECIIRSIKGLADKEEDVKINEQISSLYDQMGSNKGEDSELKFQKHELDCISLKSNITFSKSLLSIMKSCENPNMKVSEFFNL